MRIPRLVVASLGMLWAAPALAEPPELGALVSGTAAYVDGTYVWTDYAYDDRGANSDDIQGGDATYPANPYPGNTADLIQVQLGTGPGGELEVAVVLETLVPGADAVVGIGLDTDRNQLTGAAFVPGGQWQPLQPLGLEHLVVLGSDAAGTLRTWQPTGWQVAGSFPVSVDRGRNVIHALVAALPPGTATWRAVGVAGWADAMGSWVNGAHPIYDLAFLRAEDPAQEALVAITEQVPQIRRPWQDFLQSDILGANQLPTQAVASIDFGTDRDTSPPVGPGLHTFLYHSRLDLGEGVRASPLQFAGPYQPYVVYIPSGLPVPPPAVVFMHGANQNHLVNAIHFSPEGVVIRGAYNVPAVVTFPLGRDPGWGTGPAEMDLLESTDDAIARLGLDADRIVLSGISAGGIGTFRHLARYPDRWTGGYSIVGFGTTTLENMTYVPLRFHNGAFDPLVNAGLWALAAQAADAAETVDYRAVLVNSSSHLPEEAGNCWYLDMLSRPRVIDPPRVRYTVLPAQFFLDPAVGLDLHPDRAYWVSALASRDQNPAGIDVVSLARADRERVATDIARAGENASQTADFCGPHPSLRTGDNWDELGRAFAPGPLQPTSNGMTVVMTGLASATLDLARMSLTPTEGLTLETTGDGVTELRLLAAWSGPVQVERDGVPFDELTPASGAIVLADDMSGAHTYVLRGDQDGDGVVDDADNCPSLANVGQEDSGGINTMAPDGIGDACQCGDVTGNGVVNGQDGVFMTRYGLGYVDPLFAVPGNCDVTGNGLCNGQDGVFTTRAGLGVFDPLTLAPQGQNCPNADPLVPCPYCP